MPRNAFQEAARLTKVTAVQQELTALVDRLNSGKVLADSLRAKLAEIVAGVETGAFDAADLAALHEMLRPVGVAVLKSMPALSDFCGEPVVVTIGGVDVAEVDA